MIMGRPSCAGALEADAAALEADAAQIASHSAPVRSCLRILTLPAHPATKRAAHQGELPVLSCASESASGLRLVLVSRGVVGLSVVRSLGLVGLGLIRGSVLDLGSLGLLDLGH